MAALAKHMAALLRISGGCTAAFLKTQIQSMPRNRTASATEIVNQMRDANTARLKEQWLNEEALDRTVAEAAPPD